MAQGRPERHVIGVEVVDISTARPRQVIQPPSLDGHIVKFLSRDRASRRQIVGSNSDQTWRRPPAPPVRASRVGPPVSRMSAGPKAVLIDRVWWDLTPPGMLVTATRIATVGKQLVGQLLGRPVVC